MTMDEIRQCNQGVDIRKDFLLLNNDSRTKLYATRTNPGESSTAYGAVWQFDGDDEKGWLTYDRESSRLLEDAYHRMTRTCATTATSTNDADCILSLSGGRYRVNLGTMEQINTETQFLRLVRRRIMNDGRGK